MLLITDDLMDLYRHLQVGVSGWRCGEFGYTICKVWSLIFELQPSSTATETSSMDLVQRQ